MTAAPVPPHATGRVGQIAQLRRVAPGQVGRLVAVRRFIGPMSTLAAGPRPVVAWQVVVLGDPIERQGRSCREIVVADACLVPVSQLDAGEVDAWADRLLQQDIDQARDEADRLRAALGLPPEGPAIPMDAAGTGPGIDHLLAVVPVPMVLAEMDFRPVRAEGGDDGPWHWSGVHEGVEIVVTAGPDLFGRWTLTGSGITRRGLMWDERPIGDAPPRGEVGLAVLGLWRAAFGRSAPVPPGLRFAADFERQVHDRRPIDIEVPTLHADGQVLRAMRRWLGERHGLASGECGPLADRPLSLACRDRLLRLEVGDTVLGCPAWGAWAGDCQVSLRAFLAMPHQHLRGMTVPLVRSRGMLAIGRGEGLRVRLPGGVRTTG